MSDNAPREDELRVLIAELYLFGELPPMDPAYERAIETFAARYVNGVDIERDLAKELSFFRRTVRYARHVAGLPRMDPPSLADIARAYRSIAGEDLTIVRQMRDN